MGVRVGTLKRGSAKALKLLRYAVATPAIRFGERVIHILSVQVCKTGNEAVAPVKQAILLAYSGLLAQTVETKASTRLRRGGDGSSPL